MVVCVIQFAGVSLLLGICHAKKLRKFRKTYTYNAQCPFKGKDFSLSWSDISAWFSKVAGASCYRRFQEAQQRSSRARLILLLYFSDRSFDSISAEDTKRGRTKKPGPSVPLTQQKKNSHRTGICWITVPYTRSPRLLKGKLCFFSFSPYIGMWYLWVVRIPGESQGRDIVT